MYKLLLQILAIIILISLNYSCDSLCEDEDSPSSRKEATVYIKADSLQVSTID